MHDGTSKSSSRVSSARTDRHTYVYKTLRLGAGPRGPPVGRDVYFGYGAYRVVAGRLFVSAVRNVEAEFISRFVSVRADDIKRNHVADSYANGLLLRVPLRRTGANDFSISFIIRERSCFEIIKSDASLAALSSPRRNVYFS